MSDTSASGISALTGTFLGLSVVAVSLRFCARYRARLPVLVDDWLMLAAVIAFIGASACIFLLVHMKAIGYSSFQFTEEQIIARYDRMEKTNTSLVCLTTAVFASTKTSALFFYKRIWGISEPGRRLRIFNGLVNVLIVIVALWFVAFEFLTIFQCKGHFDGFWNPKKYAKYCTITWNFLFGFSISDVILDILVLGLPIPNILQLHTTLTKKLSVLAIFMVACVALGASLARLVVYAKVYTMGVAHFNHYDSEHTLTRILFYYILECGCSIVALNMPSVWPLISGGRPLDTVVKMARSITSLASVRSNSHGSDENSADRREAHDLEAETTKRGDDFGGSFEMESLPAPNEERPLESEIVRQDSVEVHSTSKSSGEISFVERGFVASCQGGSQSA